MSGELNLKGWRQPKHGRWRLEVPEVQALLPPTFDSRRCTGLLLAVVGVFVLAVVLHVTGWMPSWLAVPVLGTTSLSRLIDGIPPVASQAERDALFPTPLPNQRVHDTTLNVIQRFTGAGWATDFYGAGASGTGFPGYSSTIFAGASAFTGTVPQRITTAISTAAALGYLYVLLPQSMLPYDASAVTFVAAVRMIREGGRHDVYDLKAYGAAGDGTTNATPSFAAAVRGINSTGSGGELNIPEGTFKLNSDPFAGITFVAPCRITGAAMQSTILKKGFNGAWFTFGVNFGFFLRWEHLTFDGQHDAGRTGTGFTYTGLAGGAGNDYHSYSRCRFLAIESHFLIGQDAAQHLSFLDCEAYPSAAQQGVGEYSFFAPSADDTFGGARHRRFTHCMFPLGTVDISGMQDVYMATCGIKRLHTSATSAEYYIAACLLGNSDASHPLAGQGAVVGCRFAGDVVLHSSFKGVFGPNFQTSGTFTDNTVAGNAGVLMHHPLGAGYRYVGPKATLGESTGDEVIIKSRTSGFPDADLVASVGSTVPTIRFGNALAANRTVTFLTTGARNGDRFRVVRTGLGAFTLDVGPGLKVIPSATAAFVDVEFNGTVWVLTGYGTL